MPPGFKSLTLRQFSPFPGGFQRQQIVGNEGSDFPAEVGLLSDSGGLLSLFLPDRPLSKKQKNVRSFLENM